MADQEQQSSDELRALLGVMEQAEEAMQTELQQIRLQEIQEVEDMQLEREGDGEQENRNVDVEILCAQGAELEELLIILAQERNDIQAELARRQEEEMVVAAALANTTTFEVQTVSEREQCSICLDNYTVGTIVRYLPCAHKFHDACISQWIQRPGSMRNCPECRYQL